MTSNNPLNIIPPIAAIEIAAERFNPTILKMSQEEALEHVGRLREATFGSHGLAEMHAGIHPTYGKCIIQIFDAYATLIPFT